LGAAFLVAAFFAGAAFFVVAIVFPFPVILGLVVFLRIAGGVKKGRIHVIYNAVKDLPFILLFGYFLRNFTTK
jgi:hypothetical protein